MQTSKILLPGIVLLLLSTVAVHAQPETGFGRDYRARSGQAALKQSITNTVLSLALGYSTVALFENKTVKTVGASLAVYGLVIGPSTGNFYANDYLRGGLGALTRFGAALLLMDATREISGSEFANALNVDNEEVSLDDTQVIVGGALMVGSMIFNMATAPVSAREYNKEMGYTVEMQHIPGAGKAAPVLTARFHF